MSGAEADYRLGLWPGRRALVSDVDGTLLDRSAAGEGARELGERVRIADAALVLSSGRDLTLALEAAELLEAGGLPRPSGLVCGVGTEIYLWESGEYRADDAWTGRLAGSGFDAAAVRSALASVRHLRPQPQRAQGQFKVSYFVADPAAGGPVVQVVRQALADAGVEANVIYSAGRYLDLLPPPASKGGALLHLAGRFDLTGHDVVVAGDSGNDRELLATAAEAGMVAVLVANHEPEMADMHGTDGVLLAGRPLCAGVLEGVVAAGW